PSGAASRGWFTGFGRRHLAIVLVFSAVIPLSGALFKLAVDPASHHGALVGEVIVCFVIGLAAMLSVIATANRLAGVLGPAPRMAIAVLVAAIAGTVLMEAATQLLIRPLGLPIEEAEMAMYSGDLHRIAYRFSGAATWSLMLIALYAMFEDKRRATGELHTVRVAALAAERAVLEGDLRAMQAMLMLPLVRWALDGRPAVRLQLTVRRSEGALGISVESDLAEAPPSPEGDLAGVRKRLMHLYRERGRLDVSIASGKRRAVMELPLQP